MIQNYGSFVHSLDGAIMIFTNEEGKDWYELVREHVKWDERGGAIELPEHPWLTVRDGIVQHVEADPSRLVPISSLVLSTDQPVEPGMLYSDGVFSPVPAPTPEVPTSVSMAQAKIALHRAGLLEAAEEAIANLEGDLGIEARIQWANASTLELNHPLVPGIAEAIGIPQDQLLTLFVWAAEI